MPVERLADERDQLGIGRQPMLDVTQGRRLLAKAAQEGLLEDELVGVEDATILVVLCESFGVCVFFPQASIPSKATKNIA